MLHVGHIYPAHRAYRWDVQDIYIQHAGTIYPVRRACMSCVHTQNRVLMGSASPSFLKCCVAGKMFMLSFWYANTRLLLHINNLIKIGF